MVNLILLPLRPEQMAEVQELAGLPALREIHDMHGVDFCCNIDYIHTETHKHTWKVGRIREVGCSRIFFIQMILFFPEQNILFVITLC